MCLDSGVYETYTRLDDFGEHDLVSLGIFENLDTLQYVDPTIDKSCKAVDNLSNGSVMSFTLPQYLPCFQMAASYQVFTLRTGNQLLVERNNKVFPFSN